MKMPDREKLFKGLIKLVFFCGVCAFLIYTALRIEAPDQGSVIDTSITYTSTSESGRFVSTFSTNVTPSAQEVVGFIDQYVSVPEGGVDWKLFAQTKSIPYAYIDEDGREAQGVRPEFPEELNALNGERVILQGYMFPLLAHEDQTVFLFGPFPASCPYHYHVGPALVIETYGRGEIDFSYDAITLEGRLELIPREDNYNVFYRLHDAVLFN